MDWRQYLTADPQVMHGAVCFSGTRIPVSVVLANLADDAHTVVQEALSGARDDAVMAASRRGVSRY
jgi:uncharacterized protein (DUF433 family)